MTIKIALNTTSELLNAAITPTLMPPGADLKERLVLVEVNWSFSTLKLLLKKSAELDANAVNLQPFFDYLDSRWQVIKRIYQLSYNFNYKTQLTKVLLSLAQDLAKCKVKDAHHLEILMPELVSLNENMLMDLNQIDGLAQPYEELRLHHFILDDLNRVINIFDCLGYAKEDAILKHTSALLKITNVEGKIESMPIVLEAKEIARIRYSSKEANEFYRATMELHKSNNEAFSAMEALDNLCVYLKMGGMHGGWGGTDNVAGGHTYLGVRNFYDFLQKLSPADKQTVLNAHYVDQMSTHYFKTYWAELLQAAKHLPECKFTDPEKLDIKEFVEPFFATDLEKTDAIITECSAKLVPLRTREKAYRKKIKDCDEKVFPISKKLRADKKAQAEKELKLLLETEIEPIVNRMHIARRRDILCAEQFAVRFEEVKKANPVLKTILPRTVLGNKSSRAKMQVSYDHAQERFLTARNSNSLTHVLPPKVIAENKKHLQDVFSVADFLSRLVVSHNTLVALLVEPDLAAFQMEIMNDLDVNKLRNFMTSADMVITVLNLINIPDSQILQTAFLTKLGSELLATLFPASNSHNLNMLLRPVLPKALIVQFFPQVKSTAVISLALLRAKRKNEAEEIPELEKPENGEIRPVVIKRQRSLLGAFERARGLASEDDNGSVTMDDEAELSPRSPSPN